MAEPTRRQQIGRDGSGRGRSDPCGRAPPASISSFTPRIACRVVIMLSVETRDHIAVSP
jgi:hypothetical protein